MSQENIKSAIDQLSKSARGRNALQYILAWLEESGLGLDAVNQSAAMYLLKAAWTEYPMLVRDSIRETIT